jgi:hypothetical protein
MLRDTRLADQLVDRRHRLPAILCPMRKTEERHPLPVRSALTRSRRPRHERGHAFLV